MARRGLHLVSGKLSLRFFFIMFVLHRPHGRAPLHIAIMVWGVVLSSGLRTAVVAEIIVFVFVLAGTYTWWCSLQHFLLGVGRSSTLRAWSFSRCKSSTHGHVPASLSPRASDLSALAFNVFCAIHVVEVRLWSRVSASRASVPTRSVVTSWCGHVRTSRQLSSSRKTQPCARPRCLSIVLNCWRGQGNKLVYGVAGSLHQDCGCSSQLQ